ncbi:MAG: VanZ family protein [Clostridiaceae bacterium]
MNKKIINILKFSTWFLFVLYLLILVYVILLKGGSAISMAKYRSEISLSQKILGINFVALKTIILYLKGEPSVRIAIENLLGNILAFSPLGFLLPLLFKKYDRLKTVFLISFSISLFIEVLQLIYCLGSCDIDDIILNVLGSLLGFGVYRLFENFYKRKIEVVS